MRKLRRKIAFFVLSFLSVVCVFGTGFATWSFTDEAEGIFNMGVRITQSAVLGEFSAPDIKYVVLDGGTGAGINPTITGVSFYKQKKDAAIAETDNAYPVVFKVYDRFKSVIDYDKVEFGIKIEVPAALSGLLEHTAFYTSHLKDGYIDLKALTIELTDHFDDPENKKSDFVPDQAAGTFTFNITTLLFNRCFTYIKDKQPDSLEKYNLLAENLAPLFTIELRQTYSGVLMTESL